MDFYLSLDGSKAGPFSIFKVGELLEKGDATEETLAWHRGLDEWLPMREIPALEAVLERSRKEEPVPPPLPSERPRPEPRRGEPIPLEPPAQPMPGSVAAVSFEETATLAVAQPRPYIRFWARMFDCTLVYVLVHQVSGLSYPQPVPGEPLAEWLARATESLNGPEMFAFARTLFLSLLGWHVVEAGLLHLLGTTPGKALFGISVKTDDGQPLSGLTALGRSFYIYVLGVGFYWSPLFLLGTVFSFFRLSTTGMCLWDQHLRTRVEHRTLGPVRILLAIGAFFVLLTLQSVNFS